jgi:hypothetical protein
MRTPERITADEFVRNFVKFGTEQVAESGAIRCRTCKTPIELAGAYLTIHAAEFSSCVGSGTVLRVLIPYCPKCEPAPNTTGCVHVSGTMEGLESFAGAGR